MVRLAAALMCVYGMLRGLEWLAEAYYRRLTRPGSRVLP